jgi:cytochrome P450/heme-degrading monooxygenase HmoA
MPQPPTPSADPADPVAAATHSDPYGYYSRLVAERPFYYDEALGMWVASGAAEVAAVLDHAACRVRLPAEPVPATLLGSPAGGVFRHLARMNDGEPHRRLRPVVSATLQIPTIEQVTGEAERWAEYLWRGLGPASDPAEITAVAFALPAHVLGSMLGLADAALPGTAFDIGELVRCMAPGAAGDQAASGGLAAARLRAAFSTASDRQGGEGMLGAMVRGMERAGLGRDVAIANAIGFLVQAHDATAGLIGNALVALARRPEHCASAVAEPALLARVVDEVLRHDPPVQNTRRFIAEPASLAGHELQPGDAVLVLLAAANRDPAVNPDPDTFDVDRRDAQVFSFGMGAHACPGSASAAAIARAAVARLLANGVDPARLDARPAYRRSVNCRIPELTWKNRVPPPADATTHPRTVLSGARSRAMIAVIFEVEPAEGRREEYLDIAAALRPLLEEIDGFVSIERFESLTNPGRILSLSFWRDEAAVERWRGLGEHRAAQARGRAEVFRDYRLRVAHVLRDYGLLERAQAPGDSRAFHSEPGPAADLRS